MNLTRSALSTLLTSVTVASLLLAQGCAVEEPIVEEESAISTGGRSLHLESDLFFVGEDVPLPVHWTAPADHAETEIIRMYRVGAEDGAFIAQAYVLGRGQTSGVTAMPIPEHWAADPTPLEFRYFNLQGGKVATSGHITLDENYDVSIRPASSGRPAREVTVDWHAPLLHYVGDLIRMYKVGAPNENYLDFRGLNGMRQREGSVTFTLPLATRDPGPYEFRVFSRTTNRVVAISAPVYSPE